MKCPESVDDVLENPQFSYHYVCDDQTNAFESLNAAFILRLASLSIHQGLLN